MEDETREAVYWEEFGWGHEMSFVEFCDLMNRTLADIPEDCRHTAEIEFKAWDEWGSPHSGIEVTYVRPKTRAERIADLEEQARCERAKRAEMERRYEELGKALGKA